MGTVVGTCMPEIEHHQTTSDITQHAPIRRRRYGKFIKREYMILCIDLIEQEVEICLFYSIIIVLFDMKHAIAQF